jgi:hypothetical protein
VRGGQASFDALGHAHLRAGLEEAHCRVLDGGHCRHRLLARLDLADIDPVSRLQAAVGPDDRGDDGRECPVGFFVEQSRMAQ